MLNNVKIMANNSFSTRRKELFIVILLFSLNKSRENGLSYMTFIVFFRTLAITVLCNQQPIIVLYFIKYFFPFLIYMPFFCSVVTLRPCRS